MIFLNLTDRSWDAIHDILESCIASTLPINWPLTPLMPLTHLDTGTVLTSNTAGIAQLNIHPNTPLYGGLSLLLRQEIPELQIYHTHLKQIIPNTLISGTQHLCKDGYMSWHTNQHDDISRPYRLYITYNDTEGSVFKYILPGTNKVITYAEPIGWYAKLFYVEDRLPHCLYSQGNRWSIGMRF